MPTRAMQLRNITEEFTWIARSDVVYIKIVVIFDRLFRCAGTDSICVDTGLVVSRCGIAFVRSGHTLAVVLGEVVGVLLFADQALIRVV